MNSLKSQLLIAIAVFSMASVKGQTNTYFENNPVWGGESVCVLPPHPLPCEQHESYNYFIKGDTTIGAELYKQIFRKGIIDYVWMSSTPPQNCSGQSSYIYSNPSFFLRSVGQQMFVRLPGDTAEQLLYDFNLAVGDSLPLTYNNLENDIVVTAIDTVSTPYGDRKRFALSNNSGTSYLIEGIGSSRGLIEQMGAILECGFSLVCYSLNDTSYYPSPGASCDVPASISTHDVITQLRFHPNPFSDKTILKSDHFLDNATVTITNTAGQIVSQIKGVCGQTVTLNREMLPAGIYLVRLSQDGVPMATEKLVVGD